MEMEIENKLIEDSLLHPNIIKLYKNNKITNNIYSNEFEEHVFINLDGTYNWKNIEKLLFGNENFTKDDISYPKTYNQYFQYVQLIRPVLEESDSAVSRASDDGSWLNKLQWLGQQPCLQVIFKEHLHPTSVTSTVENILFLTSVLENALANVYQTIAKMSPPHLLKDLLDTQELKDTLGTCPIFFLKILMGSPESINLRNIVWHGFPLPDEIPHYFASTLLIVSASLSVLVKTFNLISRPQLTSFSRFLSKIKTPKIGFDMIPQMLTTIETSKWTKQWKYFWKQILYYYKQQNHWQFILLILPQIELILRKMYGEANEFDIRAKLNEYYITMNSIFEAKDDNRLLDGYLSRGTLHFFYDIFISPFGIRIRDKVSHGEVDLASVDGELCSVLLYAGFNLLNSHEFPLEHYESRFHLNYLAYEAIKTSKIFVLELMKIKTPNGFGIEFIWNLEAVVTLQGLDIVRPVEIFRRPKKEPEIMTIAMKIAQLVVQVCENYQMSFKEHFRMFCNHELRSRTRKTLERMVETLSVISETLANIVECLVEFLILECFESRFVELQRFGKQTLKIVENFVRYSDKESNEWLKALECCNRFKEINLELRKLLKVS